MRLLTCGTPRDWWMGPSRKIGVAAAVAALLILGGCEDTTHFAPPCPHAAILGDAADLVRYRAASAASPTGHDVTDMVLAGRITGIGGKCSDGEHHTVKVVTTITMDITRGPAATGRQGQLTYFVAVAKGQDILDKQDFPVGITFPANIDVVHVTSPEIVLNLPTDAHTSGAAYSVYTGFQLSPAELAARHGTQP